MAAVDQQAQPRTAGEDFEQTFESIKIVPFAKGPMIQVRCVRMEGEGEDAWVERTFRTYRKALHELEHGASGSYGVVIR